MTYSGALCGPSISGLYHYADASINPSLDYSSDAITIGTIPGGAGLLKIPYLMQGTISASGNDAGGSINGNLGDGDNNANTVVFSISAIDCIATYCGTGASDSAKVTVIDLANGSTLFSTVSADPNLSNTWDYSVYGLMIIPVTSNGSNALNSRFTSAVEEVGGPAYGGSNDFGTTASLRIGGAQIYNSAGTSVVPGVSIVSGSGFDYTQSIPATPEPATFGLIAIGLAALALRRRHRF